MFEQSNNNLSAELAVNQQYENFAQNNNTNDQFQTKLLELQQIQIVKIKSLEKILAEKEGQIQFYEQKQYQLEKDFEFNLQVIEERDQDIHELSQKMLNLKQIVEEKNSYINSLLQEVENQKFNYHQSVQNFEDQKGTFYEKIDQFKFENKNLKARLGEKIDENEKLKNQVSEMKKSIDDKIKEALNAANQVAQEKIQILTNQLQILKKENEDSIKQQTEVRRSHDYSIQKQQDKLLLENENYLRMLNDEKLKNIEITKKLNEEISNLKQKIQDQQITVSTQQKEIEGFKASKNTWNALLKEKMEIVNNEKDKLQEKLSTKKHKYQQKLKEQKDSMDRKFQILNEDQNSQIRQFDQIIRELKIENEKLNLQCNNQTILLQDRERKYQKDVEEIEDKFRTFRKNQEQQFKQQINDKNVTDFHLKQKNEELQKWQKENSELKQKLDQFLKQIKEIENENELLIQEIVKYRKQPPNQNQQQQNQNNQIEINGINLDSQRQKKPQNLQKGKKKINLNSSMQFEEDVLINQKNTIQNDSNFLQNQIEDESIEKIFTGDEGPVSPLRSKNFNLDFLSNNKSASLLVNSILLKNKLNPHNHTPTYQKYNESLQRKSNQPVGNNSKLQEKIASLESEIEAYRHLIETLALEMENVNKESYRIKNENSELKQRIGELQMDIMNYREKLLKSDLIQRTAFEKEQEIEEKDKELQKVQKRVEKHKSEIERLKREREQLISISSDLREKLQEQEDIIEQKDEIITQYKDNYIFINKFDMRKPTQLHMSQLEILTEQGSKQLSNNNNNNNNDLNHPTKEEDEKDLSFNINKNYNQKSNNHSQSPNRNKNLQNKNTQKYQHSSSNQRSDSKNSKKNTSLEKQSHKKEGTSQKLFKKRLPKYDQFQEIDEFINTNTATKSQRVNNFFNSKNNDDNQYYDDDEHEKKQLYIQSLSKPILDRQEDEKQAQYIPNSLKATPSQLEKLEKIQDQKRLQSNNNSYLKQENNPEKQPQNNRNKVRNYSIKDDSLN
ncbi:hypothetical protein ABPG72_003354 [Tetrahymena utriculariae]